MVLGCHIFTTSKYSFSNLKPPCNKHRLVWKTMKQCCTLYLVTLKTLGWEHNNTLLAADSQKLQKVAWTAYFNLQTSGLGFGGLNQFGFSVCLFWGSLGGLLGPGTQKPKTGDW